MKRIVRIGTRESQLAIWQATAAQQQLSKLGINSTLVYLKSDGDTNLTTPIYAMGVQGVFTKTLDTALLNDEIDIAVHSMKDVPVQLAQGLTQAAVLERGDTADVFVWNDTFYVAPTDAWLIQPATHHHQTVATGEGFTIIHSKQATQSLNWVVATSSIRRMAQWLHYFPNTIMHDIRGNINSRMEKTQNSTQWQGTIFAAAGLQRIGLAAKNITRLSWMLPAPSQGAIIVVGRSCDSDLLHQLAALNHAPTALCTKVERDFLQTLLGGCATPISAKAIISHHQLYFEGNITMPNGSEALTIKLTCNLQSAAVAGVTAGSLLLANGGKTMVTAFG